MQTTIDLDKAFASLSVTLGGVVPDARWLLLASDPSDDPPPPDDSLLDEILELRCASL